MPQNSREALVNPTGMSEREFAQRLQSVLMHDLASLGSIMEMNLPDKPLKLGFPSWSTQVLIKNPRIQDPVVITISWNRHSGLLYLNQNRWIIRPSPVSQPKVVWSIFDRLDNRTGRGQSVDDHEDTPTLEEMARFLSFDMEKGMTGPMDKVLSPVDVFSSPEERAELLEVLREQAATRELHHPTELRIVDSPSSGCAPAFQDHLVCAPMLRFRVGSSQYFPDIQLCYWDGSFFFSAFTAADGSVSLSPFTPVRRKADRESETEVSSNPFKSLLRSGRSA